MRCLHSSLDSKLHKGRHPISICLVRAPVPPKSILSCWEMMPACFQGPSRIRSYFYGESSKIFISWLSSTSLGGCREWEATFTENAFHSQLGSWWVQLHPDSTCFSQTEGCHAFTGDLSVGWTWCRAAHGRQGYAYTNYNQPSVLYGVGIPLFQDPHPHRKMGDGRKKKP